MAVMTVALLVWWLFASSDPRILDASEVGKQINQSTKTGGYLHKQPNPNSDPETRSLAMLRSVSLNPKPKNTHS